MKLHHTIILILSVGFTGAAYAQRGIVLPRSAYIEPFRLEVTYNKTSNLVFPDAITSVDRGSQDIVVQKAEGVENILKVKAGTKTFEETNLSVITRDGKLYSFLVRYNDSPEYLNIRVDALKTGIEPMSDAGIKGSRPGVPGGSTISTNLEKLRAVKSNLRGIKEKRTKMYAEVNALYIDGEVMYCRVKVINHSLIDFTVDGLRFFIRDKKAGKRTAAQETELTPLQFGGNTSGIKGKGVEIITVALPKFTLPDGKYLAVEISEKEGGRALQVKMKNRHVMKARLLSGSK